MPKYWYDKKLHYKDLGFEVVKPSKVSKNRYRKVMADDKVFDTLADCAEYLGTCAGCLCRYLTNQSSPPDNIIKANLRYEDEEFHIFKSKKSKRK